MQPIFLVTFVMLLTACSPRYIVKTHYSKPLNKEGNNCIQRCEHIRDHCQQNCNHQYNRCQINAKQEAKENFVHVMREYDLDMRDYYHEMDRYHYEFDRWEYNRDRLQDDYRDAQRDCARIKSSNYKKDHSKSDLKKRNYLCKKSDELDKKLYHHTHSLRPTEPIRPDKPTLSEEIAKFQEQCTRQCGCTKSYDRCFVSCGGKLYYEKICVENCQ